MLPLLQPPKRIKQSSVQSCATTVCTTWSCILGCFFFLIFEINLYTNCCTFPPRFSGYRKGKPSHIMPCVKRDEKTFMACLQVQGTVESSGGVFCINPIPSQHSNFPLSKCKFELSESTRNKLACSFTLYTDEILLVRTFTFANPESKRPSTESLMSPPH